LLKHIHPVSDDIAAFVQSAAVYARWIIVLLAVATAISYFKRPESKSKLAD